MSNKDIAAGRDADKWKAVYDAANAYAAEYEIAEDCGELQHWPDGEIERAKACYDACNAISRPEASDEVVVPREPTREILSAMCGNPLFLAASDEQAARETYHAVIAAATGEKGG